MADNHRSTRIHSSTNSMGGGDIVEVESELGSFMGRDDSSIGSSRQGTPVVDSGSSHGHIGSHIHDDECSYQQFRSPQQAPKQRQQRQQQVQRRQKMMEGTLNIENGEVDCIPVPYQQDVLGTIVENAQDPNRPDVGYDAIVSQLTQYNVQVYEITYESTLEGGDLLGDIRKVARKASSTVKLGMRDGSNSDNNDNNNNGCCLLYRDRHDRLFNLTIQGGSVGLTGAWQSALSTFSGFEATVAMTVLTRSFACALQDEGSDLGVKPAYLSLILGLVLSEEISLSHLNIAMLVWGAPSVSSYEFLFHFSSDWPRKLIVFVLAMAGSASSNPEVQHAMTLFGVSLACLTLAANLGARAWSNLKLKPMEYGGVGSKMIVATLLAVCTGLTVPYLGHREVLAGGTMALLHVVQSALMVAIVFVLSDFDAVQKFLIVGSEYCNQDIVNLTVGVWWALSLMASLYFCPNLQKYEVKPSDAGGAGIEDDEDDAPILTPAHDSPVGYKVPNIPDFPIDQTLSAQPRVCGVNAKGVQTIGFVMAVLVGSAIIFLSFTDVDDQFTGSYRQ